MLNIFFYLKLPKKENSCNETQDYNKSETHCMWRHKVNMTLNVFGSFIISLLYKSGSDFAADEISEQ